MPQIKKKTSAQPKFVRQSAEARREMLIDAGLACLARDGILGFTIDRICTEAKVSRGLITHHFKSIDGLLAAVYETMYGKALAIIERARRGRNTRGAPRRHHRRDVFPGVFQPRKPEHLAGALGRDCQ